MASAISAIDLPARSATVPNIVPRRDLASALSLNFAQFQTATIAGPAVGGVLIARLGLPLAYAADVATFAAALITVYAMSPQPVRDREPEAPLVAIARGLRFVFQTRPILAGFAADINAMFFGMPRAVFPGLAVSSYHGGAAVLGLLYAAPALGAVVGSLGSGFIGRLRHQGRAVLIAVAAWGVTIALFGFTLTWLWLGLLLLAIGGAADAISAITRGTILQSLSPDRLRGRLSAANSMVVVGGPYIGDFRAGTVASVSSPGFALASGGLICIGLVGVIGLLLPEMWSYDSASGLRPE